VTLPGADIFERAGLKAWPGIEVEWDGNWVRRATLGYTQRANSVQSLDPRDDANAVARLTDAAAWFEARGLPPIFRVTPLAGPGIIAALDAAGWRAHDASHLFAMELNSIEPDERGRLYEPLDPEFLRVQQTLQGCADERLERMRRLLEMIETPGKGVVLFGADGAPVASGLMVIADGIVVTGLVFTDPAQRRKGFGAAMMRTGLAWAHAAGASIAALNVAADNPDAHALYHRLGYTRQYDYSYRYRGTA
jgi:GNAT superfamily N-acetyltransferase